MRLKTQRKDEFRRKKRGRDGEWEMTKVLVVGQLRRAVTLASKELGTRVGLYRQQPLSVTPARPGSLPELLRGRRLCTQVPDKINGTPWLAGSAAAVEGRSRCMISALKIRPPSWTLLRRSFAATTEDGWCHRTSLAS